MAIVNSTSGTLTNNVVTRLNVNTSSDGVEIVNRSQNGELWVRLDGTDPTIAGDNCFIVLGARLFPTVNGNVDVRLIASTPIKYTVEGIVVQ